MTKEQKAKELVDKFTQTIWESGNTVSKPMVVACARICVEEILSHIEHRVIKLHDATDLSDRKYWKRVLTHLK